MTQRKPAGASDVRSKWRRVSRYGYTHRRRCTAVHEAGHSVIGRVLTLAFGGATIKPNRNFRGSARYEGHYATEVEQWERGKMRSSDALWHGKMIAYMAGAVAVQEIIGETVGLGDRTDRDEIQMMQFNLKQCRDWTKLERRLRGMTRMLVRRHRDKIVSVAEALLEQTTLTSLEIDSLARTQRFDRQD